MNVALLMVALLCVAAAPRPVQAQMVAYVGGIVWDGTGSPPDSGATLLVRDGRVAGVGSVPIPADAMVVDLSGRFVMPGLVDVHAHVTGRWASAQTTEAEARVQEDLLLFARYGVTSVVSLGDEPPEAFRVRDALPPTSRPRARLRVAGPVITAVTEAEAREAVRANAEAGGDWIKIRVDDNLGTTEKMPWQAVGGVLEESHERGLRVATHLFYLDDAKRLLREGSDLIAHSVRDRDVDAEFLRLLQDRGVCYVPTLTRELSTFVYAERPAFFDDPFFRRYADPREVARLSEPGARLEMARSVTAARYREALRQAQANLSVLVQAGVPVALGTDAGPPARFPGYFEHLELELMAEAGLDSRDILMSATSVAASGAGLDQVGTLEVGRWADFLVLSADPLQNVANTKSLEMVYVAGRPVR